MAAEFNEITRLGDLTRLDKNQGRPPGRPWQLGAQNQGPAWLVGAHSARQVVRQASPAISGADRHGRGRRIPAGSR
jgi:hypothetical protein